MSTAALVHTPEVHGPLAAPVPHQQRAQLALLRPIAKPQELVQAQEEIRELVMKALKEGRDYGVIPGTDKPAMLKSGAERTTIGMGCYYGEPRIVEEEIDHDREVRWIKRKKRYERGEPVLAEDGKQVWDVEEGISYGLYRYVIRVPIIDRATNQEVGHGIGVCSTMESKYVDRPRDSENTALKMAKKRAAVDACLTTFGLSDQFTQDVEEQGDEAQGSVSPAAANQVPSCPKCGGRMWDDRKKKKNPKAPDFKCRDRSCDGLFWPGQWKPDAATAAGAQEGNAAGATPGGSAPAGSAPSATGTTSAAQATAATTTASAGPVFPYEPHKGVPLDARNAAGEYVVDDMSLADAQERLQKALDRTGAKKLSEENRRRALDMLQAIAREADRRAVEADDAAGDDETTAALSDPAAEQPTAAAAAAPAAAAPAVSPDFPPAATSPDDDLPF